MTKPLHITNAFALQAADAGKPPRINIYGDLFPAEWGGIDETLIADALQQIGDVDQIDLHINSRGGSVFTGWAVRNLLAQHSAQKNIYIDGVAASSAATIAMTLGGTIYMPANALVMFHESQLFVMGSKTAILEQVQQAVKIDEACVALFAEVTGKSKEQVTPLFSDGAETWMNADDAKAFGFPVEQVAALPTPKPASDTAKQSLFSFRHAPATAVALLSTIPDGAPSMATQKPNENKPTENTPAPANPSTTTPPAPTQAAPSPATASTPAPGGAGVSLETPAPAPAPTQTVTMSKDDLTALVTGAVTTAVTQALATQKAASDNEEIVAVCQLAGCSAEQTQSYIDRKFSLPEVRQLLGKQLDGKETPPAGGGASGADPHQKFRDEFKSEQAAHKSAFQGISEEQFVRTRCKEEGIDPPAKKAA